MKICFISALFCEPQDFPKLDKPGHFGRNENYDYFLFTNLNFNMFDTSWNVINIGSNANISNVNCQIKKSRYPKFLSWHLLESLGKKYDVVFYCDAWVVPNEKKDWNSDVYLASLRLHDILLDPNKCIQTAKNKIQDNLNERDLIIKYLDTAYELSNPVYAAISLNKDQLSTLIENKIFSYIFEWLKLKNLPLSLLLGVKRQINKEFLLAGDGIDRVDLSYLSKLCNKYPKNNY